MNAPSRGVLHCTPKLLALRLLTPSDRFAFFIRSVRARWGRCFARYDATRERLVAVKLFKLDLPPERAHQLVAEFERLIAADLDASRRWPRRSPPASAASRRFSRRNTSPPTRSTSPSASTGRRRSPTRCASPRSWPARSISPRRRRSPRRAASARRAAVVRRHAADRPRRRPRARTDRRRRAGAASLHRARADRRAATGIAAPTSSASRR